MTYLSKPLSALSMLFENNYTQLVLTAKCLPSSILLSWETLPLIWKKYSYKKILGRKGKSVPEWKTSYAWARILYPILRVFAVWSMLWAIDVIRFSSIKTTDVQANFNTQDFILHGVLKNGQVKRRVRLLYNPNLRFSQRCFWQFHSARL
jgi:hypothetical protein